ncbi:MAG: hypothetical protein ACREFN_12065, partial [Acetobacteraceae bacterium]
MLEVPSGPIVADVLPFLASTIGLDHRLDKCASVPVLDERKVEQAGRESYSDFVRSAPGGDRQPNPPVFG